MYISSVMVSVWDTTQVARNILSPLDNRLGTFTPKLWVTGYPFFWGGGGGGTVLGVFFFFLCFFPLYFCCLKKALTFFMVVLLVGNVKHD